MPRNPDAKNKILELFYTVPRLTIYHIANTRKGIHSNEVSNARLHVNGLLKQGLIKKCNNQIAYWPRQKYRFTYYKLTDKGVKAIGYDKTPGKFSIEYPHPDHQYGLRMALAGIFKAHQDKYDITAEIPKYGDKKYKFIPDYILRFYDGTPHARIIEFENSKSLSALCEDIKKRHEMTGANFRGLPFLKDTKFVYIINSNGGHRPIRPYRYYDEEHLEEQKLCDRYFDSLLERVNHLPFHKFRFAMLHQFKKFGEGVWRTPQGHPVKLI